MRERTINQRHRIRATAIIVVLFAVNAFAVLINDRMFSAENIDWLDLPLTLVSSIGNDNSTITTLRRQLGEDSLIFCWASWCEFCKAQIAMVISGQQTHKLDGQKIILISVDESSESATLLQQQFIRSGLRAVFLRDHTGSFWSSLGGSGLPYTIKMHEDEVRLSRSGLTKLDLFE